MDPRQGRPEGKGRGVSGALLLGPPAVHLRLLGGSSHLNTLLRRLSVVSAMAVVQTYPSVASRPLASWRSCHIDHPAKP